MINGVVFLCLFQCNHSAVRAAVYAHTHTCSLTSLIQQVGVYVSVSVCYVRNPWKWVLKGAQVLYTSRLAAFTIDLLVPTNAID